MFTARRWWERLGLQLGLLGLVVGGALVVRQTQGELLVEFYDGIMRPFEVFGSQPNQDYLTNAKVQELQAKIVELDSEKENVFQKYQYSTANLDLSHL